MFNIFKRDGLPKKAAVEIERLAVLGNSQLEEKDLRSAFSSFSRAFELLPEPKNKWAEATWIFAALGDVYVQCENYNDGLRVFADAMHCPNAIGNPYLHFKLGQCQFETGNFDRAADEFARAYMGAGSKIFKNEQPKYFDFLKTKLEPPIGGVW